MRTCSISAGCDAHGATLAGPPGPSKVLPETALRVAFRKQDPGTRVLCGIELKNHPSWIWNTRIRRRVELPDIIV